MLEILIQDYADLSDEEKAGTSNNGSGKEYATYIRIKHNGETIRLESDAVEPEDANFGRDFSWVAEALMECYEFGKLDEKSGK